VFLFFFLLIACVYSLVTISYIGCSYIGCLMYADDLVLLSASLTVLQQMVDVCEQEVTYLDMKFNASKSMVLRIGKARRKLCDNIRLAICINCEIFGGLY